VIALVGDIEIGFEDVGAGIPLVLLHAFPLDRTMWSPQLGALVDQARCIAPDLRGFGETTASAPFSMDRYADDVAGLLDALHISSAVIAGLSMGGYVAFGMWRRHRHRIRGLVLADTRATPDTVEARALRESLIELALTKGSDAVAGAQIAGLVGKSTRAKRPDIYDSVHRLIAQASPVGIVGALQAMMARPDSTPLLSGIDVPTLIIVGAEDGLTPAKESRAMHSAIAGSRLEVLAHAGHLSSVERPAAFNTVLSEFLAGLRYS
jgi:3-oxoadipate enol-lactonase